MKLPKMTIVLIGCHGSGKTTIGLRLSRDLHLEYHEEIGKKLRAEVLQKHPGLTAEKAQPDFDIKVFKQEMSRDNREFDARIVETWHPGNLAFASVRSPKFARRYHEVLQRHVLQIGHSVAVQPLEIDHNTAEKRLSEPGEDPQRQVDFFMRVYHATLRTAQTWGLSLLPPVHTDRLSIMDSISAVRRNLEDHGILIRVRKLPDAMPPRRLRAEKRSGQQPISV